MHVIHVCVSISSYHKVLTMTQNERNRMNGITTAILNVSKLASLFIFQFSQRFMYLC